MLANIIDILGNASGRLSYLLYSRKNTGRISSRGPSGRSGQQAAGLWTSLLCRHEYLCSILGSGTRRLRVPRLKNGRKAAGIPMAVGAAAQMPHPMQTTPKRYNKKERRKAIRSAIAQRPRLGWSRLGAIGSRESCLLWPRTTSSP